MTVTTQAKESYQQSLKLLNMITLLCRATQYESDTLQESNEAIDAVHQQLLEAKVIIKDVLNYFDSILLEAID